ncbi:MAG: antiterminator LoaP [Lachnospiraceae bacterium]|nr:antiterminator LoaP [Lachnospiraceae bacterium]
MWYVLQVMSGREADLQQLFSLYFDQELLQDCFCPTYEVSYKKNGTRKMVQRRLFPGYLFLVTEDIRKVEWQLKGIPDLTKILKVDREYIPLTEAEQTFMEQHLSREHVLPMSRGYQIGEEIRITEGAFAGYQGRLKAVDRHNRYGVISLEMFGRNVDMQFGLEVVGKM